MNQIARTPTMRRTVIEHTDGGVSYIMPAPAVRQQPVAVHLTAREQMHCAWLRVRSAIAMDEIQRRGNFGAYTTESTLEYSRQVDDFERRIAQIHANAAAREQRVRISFYKQSMVGLALIGLIALGFKWWMR